jgi:hypothetical protein
MMAAAARAGSIDAAKESITVSIRIDQELCL